MTETQLKMQHATAVRDKDAAEIKRTEKELKKLGITGEWLSDMVLIWRHPEQKKRRGRPPKSTRE